MASTEEREIEDLETRMDEDGDEREGFDDDEDNSMFKSL